MTIKKSLFSLFILFCAAFAQDKPKIAVYVANGELKESEEKMLVTKILVPFIQSGQYKAVERSEAFLSSIAREKQKQRDGSVDDSQISRLGKEAGIQFICVADLVDAFGIYSVSARLIDVESAEIVGFGEAEMSNLGEIGMAANKVFAQISGHSNTEKQNIAPANLQTEEPKNQNAQEQFKYEYKNFTTGRRWATWGLNWVPGLGSIALMKDWGGAVAQWVLFFGGYALMLAGSEEYCSGYYCETTYNDVGSAGAIMVAGYLIYNIYRSASYDKPQNVSYSKYEGFNFAVMPSRHGNFMPAVTYNKSF